MVEDQEMYHSTGISILPDDMLFVGILSSRLENVILRNRPLDRVNYREEV